MAISRKVNNYLPIIVFLAGMLPVLYNIGTLGLLEPTEGLIGSIARYMIDSNNLSTPILNGIKHFELPPGVYWITAFGFKFFGFNELGARFFLSVAAGITAVSIYFIAKLFFGVQCAVISGLLLCTSALFQISFRFLSPVPYSTAFEALLCLCFFYYLNKPTKALRLTFWLILSVAFMFSGFGVLLPIIAVTLTALYTGQKEIVKKLYKFIPGIISFVMFGLGWYFIQVIINPGLLKYLLIDLPINNFFHDYRETPFFMFLFLPVIAVFPWTSIWLIELKQKIKDIKDDPAVAYLVIWAFLPFFVRLLMCSRECSQFLSSLPPLLLLTAPAFQSIYFCKDENTKESLEIVKVRRMHNLSIIVASTVAGLTFSIWGFIISNEASVISKTLLFTGIFWLFSSLIMIAFRIKKLNKSVLVPAAMLIPSLILFTVPAIQGHEPLTKNSFLPSKHVLLSRINRMPTSDFICCAKPLNAWYFYTGKNYKNLAVNNNLSFLTQEGADLIIGSEEEIARKVKSDSFFVMPAESRDAISKILNKKLELSVEESGWIVVYQGENK